MKRPSKPKPARIDVRVDTGWATVEHLRRGFFVVDFPHENGWWWTTIKEMTAILKAMKELKQ